MAPEDNPADEISEREYLEGLAAAQDEQAVAAFLKQHKPEGELPSSVAMRNRATDKEICQAVVHDFIFVHQWAARMLGIPDTNNTGTHQEWLETVAEAAMCAAERDKLQRFKDYVHARLDAVGVTVDPESSHKAEGCRIGGRLDEVFAERDVLRSRVAALEEFVEQTRFSYRLNLDAETEGWVRRIGEGAAELLAKTESTKHGG